jgi:hypothetical protein
MCCTDSTCSLASADSHLHCSPGCEPSPTAKSTSIAERSYATTPAVALSTPLQSLATCESSALSTLPSPSTSYSEASPARISVLQAVARAWTESAPAYIAKSSGSSVSFDRASCSWKTSLQSALTPGELSKTWPASGSIVDGRLYPLPKSGRRIAEIGGGSLLPTLSASSYGSNQGGAAGRTGPKRYSLLLLLLRKGLLPTTTKGNYNRAGLSERSGDGLLTALSRLGATEPTREFLCWFMGFPSEWLTSGLREMPSSPRKPEKPLEGC